MREDKIKVFTYSERGIMDSLIYSLDEENARNLISMAFTNFKKDKIAEIEFYLEQTLSQFGDPDLMISFKHGAQKILIFVEAKVSNGNKNWSLNDQYKQYKNNKCSNFFWQMGLKMLLIDNCKSSESKLIAEGVNTKNKHIMRKRTSIKLGKNPVVHKLFNDIIKNTQEFYYLGIVPTDDKVEFTDEDKDLFGKIKYLTWRKIKDFAAENHLTELMYNFEWNKGLIFNDL